MTLDHIITHNRDALLRVLAALFASVRLVTGGSGSILPRHMRRSIRNILRPAEAALRRLIFLKARGLVVPVYVKRTAPAGKIPRGGKGGDYVPPFPLFDPHKRFEARRRKYARHGPRISFFDGSDAPREAIVEPPEPKPDDRVDAARLLRRMESLKRALESISAQAKRMARAMERRRHAPPGPGCVPPLRPGWPPGHRQRGHREIDRILSDCHIFALRMLNAPPDTS